MEEESFDYRSEAGTPEKEYDKVLRPKRLTDFSGQPQVVENLEIFVQAAVKRGEPLDHVLLHGPPGLGKTTLAKSMVFNVIFKQASNCDSSSLPSTE